jgi:DNA-binding CsgD family transcriptional regulator
MGAFRRRDVEAALEIVEAVSRDLGPDPFPLQTLRDLGAVVGADVAVGYCEAPVTARVGAYELVTRPAPEWLFDALAECGHEDPTHALRCHASARPVAISDFVSAAAFARSAVYQEVCRPLGVADSLRLYLPAPAGRKRFFFFDRSRRGFEPRSRALLETLRPYLTRARSRRGVATARPPLPLPLTDRQLEILRWVARGLTNREIAARLWISEHTVRKHLENISARLGVHSRAAAAVAYAGSSTTPAASGNLAWTPQPPKSSETATSSSFSPRSSGR